MQCYKQKSALTWYRVVALFSRSDHMAIGVVMAKLNVLVSCRKSICLLMGRCGDIAALLHCQAYACVCESSSICTYVTCFKVERLTHPPEESFLWMVTDKELGVQVNSNDVMGIDPDVRQLVYTQAVASGGAASYDIMKTLYLGVSVPC